LLYTELSASIFFQGKQNNVGDCTDAKLTDTHDQKEETPNMDDDEKQGGTQKLESEWTVESPKGNDKLMADTRKKDSELPKVYAITNDMNGQHEQLQEIQLD
jgi:hypothetical protein